MKSFEVTSGKMVCSDPCYQLDTWCQGVVDNVKNGKWGADIATSVEGGWGKRISHLWVYHVDATRKDPKVLYKIEQFNGEGLPFDFGVDSGQFGFFDFTKYRNDEIAKDYKKYDFGDNFSMEKNGDEWYRAVCDLTLSKDSWGVLPNGAVSSSDYGDGSYDVVGLKDDSGEWVAFCVEYIGQEEEEDDWDDEDEYDDEDEDDEDEDDEDEYND